MKLVEWSAAMELGIPELDEQHKRLVELLSELYASCERREGGEGVRRSVRGMMRYAVEHFSFEERMMRDAEYGALEVHRREHEHFMDQVQAFEHKLYEGRCEPGEVVDFLVDWLMEHILASDMAFARPLVR